MIRIALVLLAVPLLFGFDGGCQHTVEAPVMVYTTPEHPQECFAGPVVRPRLPDRDILVEDAAIAARDRRALTGALDKSEAYRSVCRAALEAQKKGS